MAKSRNRGGAKAHRKRVQKRNQKIGIQQKKFQKQFTQMYESKMKELQEKFESLSGYTDENEQTTNTEQTVENSGSETEQNQTV